MFSSSYSANPFQQYPLPFTLTSSPPSSSIAHNDNFIFLHHHQQDLLSGHLFPANAFTVDTFSTMAGPNKASPTTINGVLKNPLPKIKKHVDKDKHRKIFTAQGPRHRRVRLSIGIARKFFDLQDLLGFDKASKTLDWLLTKSETAINELEEHTKPPLSLSTDSESLATNEDDDDDNGESQSQGRVVVSKEKPLMSDKGRHFRDIRARESRAKARARARERTREKMCNRKLKESEKASDSSLPILNKSKSETTCDELGSYSYISLSTLKVNAEIHNLNYQVAPQDNQALKEEKMEESNMTKGKLEASSECNNYSPSITQHGVDNSSSVSPSCFCAMTNMNPSRGFQIYGKSWEAYDNHRQG